MELEKLVNKLVREAPGVEKGAREWARQKVKRRFPMRLEIDEKTRLMMNKVAGSLFRPFVRVPVNSNVVGLGGARVGQRYIPQRDIILEPNHMRPVQYGPQYVPRRDIDLERPSLLFPVEVYRLWFETGGTWFIVWRGRVQAAPEGLIVIEDEYVPIAKIIQGLREYLDSDPLLLSTPEEINRWWKKLPNSNIENLHWRLLLALLERRRHYILKGRGRLVDLLGSKLREEIQKIWETKLMRVRWRHSNQLPADCGQLVARFCGWIWDPPAQKPYFYVPKLKQ